MVRKLGIRPNEQLIVQNPPPHYAELLGDLPEGVIVGNRVITGAKFVHLFATRRAELEIGHLAHEIR